MSFKQHNKPVDVIPFKLRNIGDFLPDAEYPILHPKSMAYSEYWKKRTEECIYGIWGDDSQIINGEKVGGYRWLPGNIVFYTHHTPIETEIEGQKNKGLALPLLRDVEWLVGYDLATCDGFSGFSDDRDRTCFRPIQKIERGEPLTNGEKILIDRYSDHLFTKRGVYKKYVDSRLLMYETQYEPLGNPLWFNESLNYMLLSTRRLGKSYLVINGVAVYEFTFNGARTLNEFFDQSTKTTTVVGSGNSDKTKEFFAKWQTSYDYLRTDVGSYNDGKINETGAWWWKYEGSVRKENEYLTNSVKIQGRTGYDGPGSRMWHVTYGRSASKGAGFSLNNAIIEEVGLTENVEDIHGENTPAQKSDYKFGKSIYIGTGGDFDVIEGSKKMFYNPGVFDLLPCDNLFSPGGKPTARFIPATYSQNQFRDENGNQDIQKAFEDIMVERKKKEESDTRQYLRHKASYPLSPDEIFVKYDGNSFPISNLESRLNALKSGAIPYSIGNIAYYDILNEDAYWIEDFSKRPLMDIDDLSDDNINKEGAIVQYEAPNKDRPKRKYNDRNPMYLLFVEPVRNDTGSSFVYSYVWKFNDFANPDRMQNNIVCEWFGRYDNNNDDNIRRTFAMAAYYDCNIYTEINNDNIKGMARRIKKYDWLQPNLGYIDGLESQNKKEYDIGFYVAPNMIPSLERLTNEWLRKVISVSEEIKGGEYLRKEVIMADTINSSMLCSQLISYNRSGNFDAYDGIRLLAIWEKANEGFESQYNNTEKDKELLDTLRSMMKNKVIKRRVTSLNN